MTLVELDMLIAERENFRRAVFEYNRMKTLHSVHLYFNGHDMVGVGDRKTLDVVQNALCSVARQHVLDVIDALNELGVGVTWDAVVAEKSDATSM